MSGEWWPDPTIPCSPGSWGSPAVICSACGVRYEQFGAPHHCMGERVKMAQSRSGWRCPGCTRVLSPYVDECPHCGPPRKDDPDGE